MRKAIIIGCKGQDGRLLAESLFRKDYAVTGISRPDTAAAEPWVVQCDIGDPRAVSDLIRKIGPDEIYYLAAFHHSAENMPAQEDRDLFQRSYQVHVLSLINVLDAMRLHARQARLFYAASSHIFGSAAVEPQDEQTPFNPKCVYGITKTAGLHTCRFYRNRHQLFAATGILYNHESPYRKPIFVTKKIIDAAIRIKNGQQDKLVLGNLDAEVDWGYAPDYVEAFQSILNAPMPEDFVVATGKKHRVRDFVAIAFGFLGLDWKNYVEENNTIISKSGATLVGNPRKLMKTTGWKPSVDLREMVSLLLRAEGVAING